MNALEIYTAAKRENPAALVAIRMGDFYEFFHDDARTAADVLGLTLTTRTKGDASTPMCGFPYHVLDRYLAKLVAAGHRVTVADPVESTKGQPVRRVVTRGKLGGQ